MPGFDKSRIIGLTEQDLDEFTCSICLAIFSNPMVTQCCRQTYCKDCITEWVSQHNTCPNDRKKLTMAGLRAVPRVMINLLDNMKVKCDYEFDGCSQVVRMGDHCHHLTICDYRPNQLCKTCGLIREFVSTHNCIQSLITEKEKTEEKYLNLSVKNSQLLLFSQENEQIISTLKNDLAHVNDNHQEILNKLKTENMNTVDQIKSSFVRTFEDERKIHQDKLDNLRQAYEYNVKIVSDLNYQLSDFKSKLNLSEEKCSSLEENIEELNSTVDNLRNTFEGNIKAIENERKNLSNQVYNLRQSNNNQKRVISNLENQLSNCKTGLKLSEDNCRSLEATNNGLRSKLYIEIENLKESDGKISDIEGKLSYQNWKLKVSENKFQTLSVDYEELRGELNSTIDKLKIGVVRVKPLGYQQPFLQLRSEHTKTVDEFKDSYQTLKEENEELREELNSTIDKLKPVHSNFLITKLANYDPILKITADQIITDHSNLVDQLKKNYDRANEKEKLSRKQILVLQEENKKLDNEKEQKQTQLDNLRWRYSKAEESVSDLTEQLYNNKQNYSTLQRESCQLRQELETTKTALIVLAIVCFLAIFFGEIYLAGPSR